MSAHEREGSPLTRLRRRTRLGAIALVLAFVGQVAIGALALVLTRDNTEATTEQAFTLVSDATLDRVAAFLDSVEGSVDETAIQLETDEYSVRDGSLQHQLFDNFRTAENLRALYVGFPNGDMVYVRRADSGLAFDVWTQLGPEGVSEQAVWSFLGDESSVTPGPTGFDPRLRPWYAAAVEGTGVVWSDPYLFFQSGTAGTTASRAITDTRGDLQAVIGADIELDRIGQMLSELPLGDSGEAFLLAGDRTVVAAPLAYLDQIDAYSDDLGVVVPATALGVDTNESLSVRDVDVVYGESGDLITLERWLPTRYGLPWILHIRTDRESLAPQNYVFERALTGFALAVVAVSVLGIAAYLWMWRPLRELRRQSKEARAHALLDKSSFALNGGAYLTELQLEQRQMLVAVFGVDGVEHINDERGYDAGDEALQAAREAIVEFTREGDITGRLTTTVFAVAVHEPHDDAAFRTVDRVRAVLADCVRATAPTVDGVSVTAGFVMSGDDGPSFAELLRDAQAALDGGRQVGVGRTYEFHPAALGRH